MGLFDKKYCSICNEKIGLLGNRKLADGNLCKECARKLSPRFEDRKESTVEEIREQLKYREENKARLGSFRVTDIYGTAAEKMYADAEKKAFVVSFDPPDKGNPDIVDFDMVTCCEPDVRESRKEIRYKAPDGRTCSYQPAQYAREFEFYLTLSVSHPYFDKIRFKLNSLTVSIEPQFTVMSDPNRFQKAAPDAKEKPPLESPRVMTRPAVDPMSVPEYVRFIELGNEIKAALLGEKYEKAASCEPVPVSGPASVKVTCPYCGELTDDGDTCTLCGAPLK